MSKPADCIPNVSPRSPCATPGKALRQLDGRPSSRPPPGGVEPHLVTIPQAVDARDDDPLAVGQPIEHLQTAPGKGATSPRNACERRTSGRRFRRPDGAGRSSL